MDLVLPPSGLALSAPSPSQLLSWILLMRHYASPFTARALDRYFELRVKEVELKEEVEIDPRLISIVERMLDRCAHMGPCVWEMV